MQVHYDTDKLPVFNNAVITIGTFDGVHLGHRQIIENMIAEADKIKGETVIITFHPHPRKVVSSAILGIRLINTLEEKIELLQQAGIGHLVVVPFTPAFANQTPEEYIKDFIVDKFHPHTVIIGYDHRFGKDRAGDYLLLEKKAAEFGFELKEIPKHVLNEIGVSSTKIREAILHQHIETANELLGYDYFFEGEVVHGNKLGRQLGYPTANLKIDNEEKMIPGDGIYAVNIEIPNDNPDDYRNQISNQILQGMMSIGFRPTVDGKERVVEVNIFDFAEEIYGKTIRVIVKKYLRAEVKFDNLQQLTDQMANDKIESLKVLEIKKLS